MSRRARQRAEGRKAYTPKPVHLNAIERAITGAALLPAAEVASVKTNMALSLLTFGRGIACPQHWVSMADALNMAESLAAGRICSDEASRAKIVAGQEALAAVMLRHNAGKSWTLYAAEHTALQDALWLHGVQLDHASHTEYEQALEHTRHRIAAARAGNAPRGAIVIEGALA